MESKMLLEELMEAYQSSEAVKARVAAGAKLRTKVIDVCVQRALEGFRFAEVVVTSGEMQELFTSLGVSDVPTLSASSVLQTVVQDVMAGDGLDVRSVGIADLSALLKGLSPDTPAVKLTFSGWGPS